MLKGPSQDWAMILETRSLAGQLLDVDIGLHERQRLRPETGLGFIG